MGKTHYMDGGGGCLPLAMCEKLHKGSKVLKSWQKSFRSTNDRQRAPGNCETPFVKAEALGQRRVDWTELAEIKETRRTE